MGVVVDSNLLIDLDRGSVRAQAFIANVDEEDEIFISVITVSELLHGVHRARNQAQKLRRSAFVEKLVDNIPALPVDTRIARTHAELSSDLMKKGQMIGIHDSWIAATCITHGYRLATKDVKGFRHFAGLSTITDFA